MKQRWWSKSNPTARACVGDLVAIPVALLSYERHRLQQIFPPQRQRLSPKLQKKKHKIIETLQKSKLFCPVLLLSKVKLDIYKERNILHEVFEALSWKLYNNIQNVLVLED